MKIQLAICFLFIINGVCFSQPPQGINYQGVARDSIGRPLVNRDISIRLSILDSSDSGLAVYTETHNLTTNKGGLFNLSIGGRDTVNGNFSNIKWGENNKWLKIEMDANGGINYQLLGATQFLSVPYAFCSETAKTLSSVSSNPLINNLTSGQLVSANVYKGKPIRFKITCFFDGEQGVNIGGQNQEVQVWNDVFSFQFLDQSLSPISDSIYWESLIFSQHGDNSIVNSVAQIFYNELTYKSSLIPYSIFCNRYKANVIGRIEGQIIPSYTGTLFFKGVNINSTISFQ